MGHFPLQNPQNVCIILKNNIKSVLNFLSVSNISFSHQKCMLCCTLRIFPQWSASTALRKSATIAAMLQQRFSYQIPWKTKNNNELIPLTSFAWYSLFLCAKGLQCCPSSIKSANRSHTIALGDVFLHCKHGYHRLFWNQFTYIILLAEVSRAPHVCKHMGNVSLEGFLSYRRALHQKVLPVSEPLLSGSLYYRVSKHKKPVQYRGLVGLLWPVTGCLFQLFFFYSSVAMWSGLHTKNTWYSLANSLGNKKWFCLGKHNGSG